MFCSYIYKNIFLLLIEFIDTAFFIYIGSISNTTFVSTNNKILHNLSCSDCTCVALVNISIAWNCLTMNNSCILIKNYSSNDSGLISMANSTFFFRQVPPIPLTKSSMLPVTNLKVFFFEIKIYISLEVGRLITV